jgi:hypothetical protein
MSGPLPSKPRFSPSLSPIPRRSKRNTGCPAAATRCASIAMPRCAPLRISLPPDTISSPVPPGASSSEAASAAPSQSKLN